MMRCWPVFVLWCLIMVAGASAKPILVYNEDDSHYMRKLPKEGFVAYFDRVCRGAVTHFFMCPNAMRSNVDTVSFEPIWTALEEPGVKPGWAPVAKWLHDNGVDPYAIWTARAREKGVSPWISMRMNDVHSVTDPTYCSHCRLWKEHPELKVVPNYRGNDWSSHAFDYSHAVVRERALGYIRELLERYDVDGIECDWLRFPWHLTKGREREKAPVLDAFMRDARKVVDAAAKKRGHRILLGARVASAYANACALGTDAVQWAKEGSIDWLVVCNFFSTVDFNLDYADWRMRLNAVNPRVTLVPGLDSGVVKDRTAGRQGLTLAEYRGWCAAQYAQGAPGFYMFNPFHLAEEEGEWNSILTGELTPEAVARNFDRAYPVSNRDTGPRELQDVQVNLPAGDGRSVHVRTASASPSGTVFLLTAWSAAVKAEDMRAMTLNGAAPLETTAHEAAAWLPTKNSAKSSWRSVYPAAALRAGLNDVKLPPLGDVKLMAMELETRGGK